MAEKKDDGVIIAIYKVNLHCPQCARQIKKPLMSTQGVQSVEMNTEKCEVKVKGKIDPIKIHKSIEKLSKKKVELISPKIKITEIVVEKKVKEVEVKAPIVHTTKVKVHMHCEKCEHDLKNKLLKHKGIFTVKTDMKSETLTVEGTIEPEKLLVYIKKKVHKHAEIILAKPEKAEQKKEKEKPKEEAKKPDGDKPKVEAKKPGESTEIVEFKEEIKVVEVKSKEGHAPYFIHYVYAPQLFSDENPNACCII